MKFNFKKKFSKKNETVPVDGRREDLGGSLLVELLDHAFRTDLEEVVSEVAADFGVLAELLSDVGASVEVGVVDPAGSPSVGVQESGVLGHSVSTHDVDVAEEFLVDEFFKVRKF